MAEQELELEVRLRAVTGMLDAQVPAFDVARLRRVGRQRARRTIIALVCVVVVGVAAAPAAVSSLRQLFEVEPVPGLGPLEPGVAAPFAGRRVPLDVARASSAFPVRTIGSLGAPDEARVRDDIAGGLVTVVYGGGAIRLAQWRTTDVDARIAIVPAEGHARDVTVGVLPALWIEGTARGTFTLVGADGTVHRESFEVGGGVLLWKDDGMTFLLQGVGSTTQATSLAADSGP